VATRRARRPGVATRPTRKVTVPDPGAAHAPGSSDGVGTLALTEDDAGSSPAPGPIAPW
jgi:hypothetical protein